MYLRLFIPLLLFVLALGGALLIKEFAVSVAESDVDVEWIVSVSDSNPPLGKPVVISVWAYSVDTLEIYEVTCKLAITNDFGVIDLAEFVGSPATYEVRYWTEGFYNFELQCTTVNSGYETSFLVEYRYPEISLQTPVAPWGRPMDIVVTAEYEYNEPVTIILNGIEVIDSSFTDGVIILEDMVLYDTLDLNVVFLDRSNPFEVTVLPPNFELKVYGDEFKVNTPIVMSVAVYDMAGTIPADVPVQVVVSGDCPATDFEVKPNEPFEIIPKFPGECVVEAYYANRAFYLYDTATIQLQPPKIVRENFNVVQLDNYNYRVYFSVGIDTPIDGVAYIAVNGDVVSRKQYSENWFWRLIVELDDLLPGTYTVEAVFEGEFGLEVRYSETIVVPKYEYEIEIDDEYIVPFGTDINEFLYSILGEGYWVYTAETSRDAVRVVVYYPGNEYYLPASKDVIVRFTYPELSILEDNESETILVEVANGAPGALVTVYCVVGGENVLHYQTTLETGELKTVLNQDECESVYMVYEYGEGVLYAFDNTIEAISYETECVAGVPCTPVSPSSYIVSVSIGGMPYEPGTEIMLPEGSYKVEIVMSDGYRIVYSLKVVGLDTVIAVYYDADDPTMVWVPETPLPITLVLRTGMTIEVVGTGEWIKLPAPLANAYSRWANVEVHPIYRF